MKTYTILPRSRRGSAMLTVVILVGVLAILSTSMLRYTLTERRGNERNRVIQRAKNMSESISTYAAEQITAKLYRLRSASPIAFMTGSNAITLPPLDFLQAIDSTYTSGANMEVRAGLMSATGLQFVNPATNPSSPNAGLQVSTANLPIIAKATARHAALGLIPAYSQQNFALDYIPLFQFAAFYNMDMEYGPSLDMTISGPIHCNGELSARPTGSNKLQFLDRASASKGFYANTRRQGVEVTAEGAIDPGPGGDGRLDFQHSATGEVTEIKSSSSVWRDHLYGGSTETTTTQNNFKVFSTNAYGINLRTSVHGVVPLVLPATSGYSKVNLPATPEDDRNNGREIIARPDLADTAGIKQMKISRRAGLYIVVNPDNAVRTGFLPNGNAVQMRARSYRCWLNTVNADLSHTIMEVILPGQPSYGSLNANVNNLPNRYITATSIGHNQVLRMIQGGSPDAAGTGYTVGAAPAMTSFSDAYFYDLRRAKNNTGWSSGIATGSFRASNPYTPRPIVKIDFDLTRFRMMVERTMSGTPVSYLATAQTSTIYNPDVPTDTNWNSSVYNPDSSTAPTVMGLGLGSGFITFPIAGVLNRQDPYRMYFAPADPADPLITLNPGSFAVGSTDLASSTGAKPWFDGIAVYVHSVDAEVRGDANGDGVVDRIDSAVRLWNGRGRVASLDGILYPGMTGFTFATNDAAYIVGHFNADGNINAKHDDNTNPGGYSARYPDSSSERLCAVMADAVTILSQPVFKKYPPYAQWGGWSDSLSAHRNDVPNWGAAWATSQPSNNNAHEGVNTPMKPAAMPYMGNTVSGAGASKMAKFDATTTEISSCLLVGIVPTNHNAAGLTDGPPIAQANGQNSGGVHNFPRLLESWLKADLYIRGSMVAMFESRVAMEPWTARVYADPKQRCWGLHENLRNANHDLPLEPGLLSARRLGFKEITAGEYSTAKALIEALPQ